MKLPFPLRQFWRQCFGKVSVEDPRPIAETAPYTYFLPSENELLALAVGDLVKLNIRSHPRSLEWDAERMWFTIARAAGDRLTGKLDNLPLDIPQLQLGAEVTFARSDVIDIIWNESRSIPPPAKPPRREFWDRCMVDRCAIDDGARIHFLYRETPDLGAEGDTYPDSGWRIRGDYRDVSDTELDDRETEYVALGLVLNRDDSWLHLIDAPIGSRFIRDWSRNVFVHEEDP